MSASWKACGAYPCRLYANDLQSWSSDPSLVYTLAGFNAVAVGQLVSSLIARMVNARAFPGAEVAQGFKLTDGNESEYKAMQ